MDGLKGRDPRGAIGTVRFVRASCLQCGAHLTAELAGDRLAGRCSTCGSKSIELIPDAPVQDRSTVSIFIVDDHPLIRHGLEQLLLARGHRVSGLASDGETAVEAIRAVKAEVVVVDLEMPGVGGAELIRRLRKEDLDVGIVVYTASVRSSLLVEAVVAGADGVVNKTAPVSRLAEAIEAVHRGEKYIDRPLQEAARAAEERPSLSRREREVLQRAAGGERLADIADHLYISPETARTHLRNARAKLGARTVAEAVSAAISTGEISSDRA
jgi:two-component system invasion response regulator UvrY